MKVASKRLIRMAVLLSLIPAAFHLAASAQGPEASLSQTALDFGLQTFGTTTASQTVTLSNPGSAPLNLANVALSDSFYGDYSLVNNCGASVPSGGSCQLNVTFTPAGTGPRLANLYIVDNAQGSPQKVSLSGIGLGSCAKVSDCAYQELNARAMANQNAFYVYRDADSGFNHGFPSGLFGNIDLSTIAINPACIDTPDPASPSGCSTDSSRFDGTRGTVFGVTFPAMSEEQFAGLNFRDPENYSLTGPSGNGYDLTPATSVQFDVRSPGGVMAQFGVGGCVTTPILIGPAWTTITIPIDSLFPPLNSSAVCPPDLTSTHLLFGVSTNGAVSPNGGTVLLDNIQFTPAPARQVSNAQALSLPLSTQTFGVVPLLTIPARGAYPPDQGNRNLAAIYEASLTILSLLQRGQPADITNAMQTAQALHYALYHDNHGDPLPTSPTNPAGCYGGAPANQCAFHSAYQSGDIALLNTQPLPELGQAGDARLAGFTGGCGTGSGFCLVLDGATGGNNAWALLALTAAYIQSGDATYLTDAETIGSWIVANLLDPNQPPASFGGYFVGYNDDGLPKTLTLGKSTENNADIFAAFSLLAQIETALGNGTAATQWTSEAKIAGDFVMAMYDSTNGRFYAGTVTQAAALSPGPGVRPDFSYTADNDVANSYDFLDSTSFVALAMAGSQAYRGALSSWTIPLQFLLTCPVPTDAPECFVQTVTVAGNSFQGFDLVTAQASTGVAWEFTGQVDETCNYIDSILNITTFQSCTQNYLPQILDAQNQAPFGDGVGIVAAVLQGGDTTPLANQCLTTPFQCIPERTGLAATNWGIIAEAGYNPLAYPAPTFSPASVAFSSQLVGASSLPQQVSLTNAGTAPLVITGVSVSGTNAGDFQLQSNCVPNSPLTPGASCTISVTFTPSFSGTRVATLQVYDNAFASPQGMGIAGTGQAVDDFSLSVSPASQSIVAGNSGSYTVTTAVTMGKSQSVSLSISGLPACATSSFNPNPVNSGQSSTLTINTSFACLPGPSSLSVLGTGPEAVHAASPSPELVLDASVTLSQASLQFNSQTIGTSSAAQMVVLTNGGSSALSLVRIVLSGSFAGDFAQTNTCQNVVSPGGSCTISVTFSPVGTGTRTAILYVFDSTGNSPQALTLSGIGAGSCSSIANCALAELNARANANQQDFYVYQDADSALNHGFPSVFTFDIPNDAVSLNAACVDDPTSATGCSTDPTRIDGTRGTVFSITLPAMTTNQNAGVVFQEPQNYEQNGVVGTGYDLTPATAVQFDVRTPGGISVQFGVNSCTAAGPPTQLPAGESYVTMTIPLSSLVNNPANNGAPCPPDLTDTHLLFTVAATGTAGGIVLLDNIQFTPVPTRNATAVSMPLSTQTFGVVARQNYPIAVDQALRNLSTTYESSLTALSFLQNGQSQTASAIVNSLHYALYHDNHGDPVPISPTNSAGCYGGAVASQCGLHSGHQGGDLPLLNDQPAPELALAGDVRVAGFSAGTSLCGPSGFCLVLDGATGANNAWAMLAFLAHSQASGNATDLADAETIGNWIVANLQDTSSPSYGGYFLGYSDGGLPKTITLGKSTPDNAVIFAAFNALARAESAAGNSSSATQWTNAAKIAGDFVIKMFDSTNGRFYAGTLNSSSVSDAGPGVCPDLSLTAGSDVVNSCDFLTSDTLSALAMAGAPAYAGQIDWTRPLQYILTCPVPNSTGCFTQSVTVAGTTTEGLDLVPAASSTGSAWEYTGQATTACGYVDSVLGAATLQNCSRNYQGQVQATQNSAPFGDGEGVVAATLANGDIVPPLSQCLDTPSVCIPERVSLAATNLAIFAAQGFNPLGPGYSLSASVANPASIKTGGSSTATVTITPANGYVGTVSLSCSISPAVTGVNAPSCSFSQNPVPLTRGAALTTTLTFTAAAPSAAVAGQHTVLHVLYQTPRAPLHRPGKLRAVWLSMPVLALIGLGFRFKSSRRDKVLGMVLLSTGLALLFYMQACGGGSNNTMQTCSAAPSAPGGLAAMNTTSSGTTLTWGTPTLGTDCTLQGYSVYQQGSLLATTATPSFVVTGLSPQMTYSFTVAAKDEYGVSSQSLPLSVTTLTTGTPVGNYTISITGKDGNGEVQNGAGATVSVQVSQP